LVVFGWVDGYVRVMGAWANWCLDVVVARSGVCDEAISAGGVGIRERLRVGGRCLFGVRWLLVEIASLRSQ